MVRFEAESLTLENYAPEDVGFATLIEVPNLAAAGTATIETFGEASGTYTIDIVYVDENDGSSTLELFIDDISVGTRNLDDNTGTGGADEGNLRTWTLTGIAIDSTSEIRLVGSPNNAERVRVDYLEFTAESTSGGGSGGGSTPPAEIVVQAESEDFTLDSGYQVAGDFIELVDNTNPGTAFTTFSGADGTYDIIIGYLDESDGEASLEVSVGNSSLGNFTFNDTSGGGSAGEAARLEQTFADVDLTQGERITLTGTPGGAEFARIDYVRFVLKQLANQAPVAANDTGETSRDTDLVLAVLANDDDPDEGDTLTVSSVNATTTEGGTAEILPDGRVLYRPPSGYVGSDSFTYTVADTAGATDIATANITIREASNQPSGPIGPNNPTDGLLKQTGNNLFMLDGTGATVKFSIEEPTSTPRGFEFGFYATDNIGLDPSSEGYMAATLGQATTLFSLLGDGDVQLPSLHRILSLAANTTYSFFLVEGGTVDSVLNGGGGAVTLGSLLDANAGGPLLYENLSGTDLYRLNWDTDRNGTFDLIVDLSFPNDLGVPLGTGLQGGPESELLDFRELAEVQLSVQVYREAKFNNQVGFYRIENEQGTIRVGDDLLNPGDAGYVEAALSQWANNPALQGKNGEVRNYELTLGRGLWAPFIVVGGTIKGYLDNWSGNDPEAVYFNFIAANPDGADHVKLLGDNVFGFEDLAGGGDGDFDDLIVSIRPKIKIKGSTSNSDPTLSVTDDTFKMTSVQPLTFSLDQLLSNDANLTGSSLSLQEFTNPTNGTLSRNIDGTLTYIPNPGFGGRDSFQYTVKNEQGETATATVSIDVTFINSDPIATDDVVITDENTPLPILITNILSNDTDVDNQSLSLTSVTQPSNGSLVPDNNGDYIYAPNTNFFGIDTFTYAISDGSGGIDTATVEIVVNSTNSAPVAVDDTFATEFETMFTFTSATLLANDTDPDNDVFEIREVEDPSNGSLIINRDESFSYIPDDNFIGDDSFTYTIADGEGEVSTATTKIAVLRRNSGNTANYSRAGRGVILNLETDAALQPEFGALATPRLMPLGDSITNGGHSVGPTPGAYRIQFWDRAVSDGLTIDFVGRLSNGPSRLGGQDHEGHRGDTIREIAFRVNNDTVNVEATDAILLMIGTNDVGAEDANTLTNPATPNIINTRAEAIRDRLGDLIDTITAEASNSYLYVSSIPPRDSPQSDAKIELTEAFNDLISDLVDSKVVEGKRVIYADAGGRLIARDMNGDNSTTRDLNEGLHPTAAGYENLGNFWYEEVFKPESLAGDVNLIGSPFDDILLGDGANNILAGGDGDDSLTGGGGVDVFWYRNPDEGQDTILDFSANDRIWVSASGFGNGLVAGTAMDSDAFVSGTNPSTRVNEATFLFNTSNNTLLFDSDGSGSNGATTLTTFANGYELQFNQIDIVA